MQQNHPPGRLTYNHNIVLYADNPVSGRTLGQEETRGRRSVW